MVGALEMPSWSITGHSIFRADIDDSVKLLMARAQPLERLGKPGDDRMCRAYYRYSSNKAPTQSSTC